MISPKLRNWIAGCVTVVWLLNFIATLIPQLKYNADPALHAVFMGIVGGAFALSRGDKNGNGNGGNKGPDKEKEDQPQ